MASDGVKTSAVSRELEFFKEPFQSSKKDCLEKDFSQPARGVTVVDGIMKTMR